MQTATTTYPTIGDRLAAKLRRPKLRRRARPRSKRRTTRRPAKPREDPRISQLERQIQRSPLGHQALRLSDDLILARTAETLAAAGLETAEAHERKLRERLCAVAPMRTATAYCQAADLQVDLLAAEYETRTWRAEFQRHRSERERLEAEIRHLAGYL